MIEAKSHNIEGKLMNGQEPCMSFYNGRLRTSQVIF
jgi:hypothetical protein